MVHGDKDAQELEYLSMVVPEDTSDSLHTIHIPGQHLVAAVLRQPDATREYAARDGRTAVFVGFHFG